MPRGLTKKERSFVKNYALTENGTQSVIEAKYDVKNEQVAGVIAYENLKKPHIIEAVKAEKKSLAERFPDDLLEKAHLELLNKREKVIIKKGNPVNGDTAIYEVLDQPETLAVSKGLEMAYKLKGSYAPEKTQSVNINVNTTDPKNLEIAKKYEEELKQGL